MATVAVNTIAFLASKTTITTHVGKRIHETHPRPAPSEPYIIVRRVSMENADTLGGAGESPLYYGLQIECCATDERIANEIGDAVRGTEAVPCLHEYRGSFGDATAKGCFVDSESLDFERFDDGSDRGIFTRTLEARVFL